jgi:hypothetical protein
MPEAALKGRVTIGGTIEYRDAAGNVIKKVPFNGSVPLEDKEDGDSSERS